MPTSTAFPTETPLPGSAVLPRRRCALPRGAGVGKRGQRGLQPTAESVCSAVGFSAWFVSGGVDRRGVVALCSVEDGVMRHSGQA